MSIYRKQGSPTLPTTTQSLSLLHAIFAPISSNPPSAIFAPSTPCNQSLYAIPTPYFPQAFSTQVHRNFAPQELGIFPKVLGTWNFNL